MTLADARVEQPSLTRFYLAPSRTTAKPGESEALEVLAHVLGSGANSRLYRTLVVEQGIALGAGAYYSETALDYGKFGVYGAPKPGKTLHNVEAAIDAVLANVSEHGITADELDLAKNRLIADAIYAQDNQATLARWYGAGAGDRPNRRHGAQLARGHSRRDGRRGASGRAELARPPRLGDRLSRQKPAAGGEALVNAMTPALSRNPPAPRCRHGALRLLFSPRRLAPRRSSAW